MTPAINNEVKTPSTKAKHCYDHGRIIPYPWKGGIYLRFSPDTNVVMRNLEERQALFMLSCRYNITS
jgi:hypothetical protein